MGFKQLTASENNLFGDVISGCLAGFGIWTKPSQVAKPNLPPTQASPSNVYPLRVIRVKEAQTEVLPISASAVNTQKMAGRMVISGRMADVCAELDRLAA